MYIIVIDLFYMCTFVFSTSGNPPEGTRPRTDPFHQKSKHPIRQALIGERLENIVYIYIYIYYQINVF